jgi:hypothetical protein
MFMNKSDENVSKYRITIMPFNKSVKKLTSKETYIRIKTEASEKTKHTECPRKNYKV